MHTACTLVVRSASSLCTDVVPRLILPGQDDEASVAAAAAAVLAVVVERTD